eukprot:766114-Hanusia_phi.AAC.5
MITYQWLHQWLRSAYSMRQARQRADNDEVEVLAVEDGGLDTLLVADVVARLDVLALTDERSRRQLLAVGVAEGLAAAPDGCQAHDAVVHCARGVVVACVTESAVPDHGAPWDEADDDPGDHAVLRLHRTLQRGVAAVQPHLARLRDDRRGRERDGGDGRVGAPAHADVDGLREDGAIDGHGAAAHLERALLRALGDAPGAAVHLHRAEVGAVPHRDGALAEEGRGARHQGALRLDAPAREAPRLAELAVGAHHVGAVLLEQRARHERVGLEHRAGAAGDPRRGPPLVALLDAHPVRAVGRGERQLVHARRRRRGQPVPGQPCVQVAGQPRTRQETLGLLVLLAGQLLLVPPGAKLRARVVGTLLLLCCDHPPLASAFRASHAGDLYRRPGHACRQSTPKKHIPPCQCPPVCRSSPPPGWGRCGAPGCTRTRTPSPPTPSTACS